MEGREGALFLVVNGKGEVSDSPSPAEVPVRGVRAVLRQEWEGHGQKVGHLDVWAG